ncbi:MAG TPA: hypothetical protein VE685_25660 [Thermoanaerobaculia bacterium]|nr:hypothetical protein [Thermoanaerobaculia bacterium]
MRSPDHDALTRWLAAERDDRSDEAEAALLELFEALPALAPPAGFADRVMERAGLRNAVAVRQGLFAQPWTRLVLAGCLLAMALSVLWLPQTLLVLLGTWSFGGLVDAAVGLLAGAGVWLAAAVRFGDWLYSLGSALARPLATPQVAAVVGGCLLVSTLAFRFLRDLIQERSWTHVDPI